MNGFLRDADLTVTYRRWLPPGKEVELYDVCPVCRQARWSGCRRYGTCQLIGVGAGINAAIRDSLEQLMWPSNPLFGTTRGFTPPWVVFKN